MNMMFRSVFGTILNVTEQFLDGIVSSRNMIPCSSLNIDCFIGCLYTQFIFTRFS